jgi:exocyst complex component 2
VQNVVPSQCYRVQSHIVEMVAEEVARLMSCIPNFNEEGVLQAHVDLWLLQKALSPYCTSTAKAFFHEAVEAIPPVKNEKQKR